VEPTYKSLSSSHITFGLTLLQEAMTKVYAGCYVYAARPSEGLGSVTLEDGVLHSACCVPVSAIKMSPISNKN